MTIFYYYVENCQSDLPQKHFYKIITYIFDELKFAANYVI